MSIPEFLILRHGETEWNLQGRLQGALDSPLTERGREQAEQQNRILQAFDVTGWRWYVSPQGRARATADIAARHHQTEITTDARLCEICMGDWTGLRRAEMAAQAPHVFEADGMSWYDHAPGGEGLLALRTRAQAFLADLTGPSVIVTHGITSRVIRTIAQGLPVDAFATLGGGQGVAYHICDGNSRLLS